MTEKTRRAWFFWGILATSAEVGLAASAVSELGDLSVPPILVLVSDGAPTDNFQDGLDAVMGTSWGRLAVRRAIAIGTGPHNSVLKAFVGNDQIPVLEASNLDELMNHINKLSLQVLLETFVPQEV